MSVDQASAIKYQNESPDKGQSRMQAAKANESRPMSLVNSSHTPSNVNPSNTISIEKGGVNVESSRPVKHV